MKKLSPLQWLEVTALGAVIVAATPAMVRYLGTPGLPDGTELMTTLSLTGSVVGDLVAQPLWGAKIGDGEGQLTGSAQAIRLGSAIASFELLQERGDSSAGIAALEVAKVLETIPGGFEAASAYRQLAARVPADSEIRAAARLAEKAAGARVVQLGAWLQGARFAAAGSDTTWFAGNAGSTVSRLVITIDDRADTEQAAKQFEQVVRERPQNFTAIATSVEELLRLLGTR